MRYKSLIACSQISASKVGNYNVKVRGTCFMNILVINPNTSDKMTEDIRNTVMRVKASTTNVEVLHPDFGPEALESFYDYQLAAFGMIRLLNKKTDMYDGVLISCFGDPGLYAIKEICKCPVIGIAEASMCMAELLGSKFAILTASEKAVPMMDNMVLQYGKQDRLAGVFTLNMNVLDSEKYKEKTVKTLIDVGQKALEKGAEVLIPGCAGMTGITDQVEKILGVPVLDPVGISFNVLEMLVKSQVNISRSGLYAKPAEHRVSGLDLLRK